MSPGNASGNDAMSPGATFERVHTELKRMLAEGDLPPGSPIEPALIGKQIASSITPIRDALHRLTGERLVEAPNHNGFRVPLLTEAALRDLYAWRGQLLRLAVKFIHFSPASASAVGIAAGEDVAGAAAGLFSAIAQASGSPEHARAVNRLNDRLAPFHRAESHLLGDLAQEYELLAQHFAVGESAHLGRLLRAYHRRRIRAASDILVSIAAQGVRGI
jgi:hypothetical protein